MFRIIPANILEQVNLRRLTIYGLVCFKYELEERDNGFMRETDSARHCTTQTAMVQFLYPIYSA